MVKGKTTNGLMRHLRETHGISVNGTKHKKELLNMGYYHGYKGYRFIRQSTPADGPARSSQKKRSLDRT